MKNNIKLFCFLSLYISLSILSCTNKYTSYKQSASPRVEYDFDLNWKFKLGDIPEASNMNYSDTDWRSLKVPHDWSIEGEYDKDNPASIQGAFLPTGIGWYRKTFYWHPEWNEKRISIQFDGVYCNSTLWVNGVKLGTRPNGYIGFSYDLSPHLQKGKNVIAVKVDHSKAPTGRWYTGSGIYRHVKLLVNKKVYVPEGGLFIKTPKVDDIQAIVDVNLEVVNETGEDKKVKIIYKVIDKAGKNVSSKEQSLILKQGIKEINNSVTIETPDLWSTETPDLYNIVVEIFEDNHWLDNFKSTFGVRSIAFSAKNGFQLNGIKTILKGVCNHHDAGPVGSARDRVFLQEDLSEKEVFEGINPLYYSSYDNAIVRMSIRDYWKTTKNLDYFLGAFRWTGFDYLGESFEWPARTMNFGVIDLAGFPTDNYYLYQSIWSDQPMVHVLPHWTHTGKEGIEIPVVAYTNCDSAELFLNGNSLGEKPVDENLRILWKVPYTSGTLKVVAKNNGKIVEADSVVTAGEPCTTVVNLDKNELTSNQRDVSHVEISVVDSNGVEVPGANNLLNFEIEGPGKIIGVENGDILDLNPAKANYRKAFNGKCLVLIQSTDKNGEISLKITSEGILAQQVRIKVRSNTKNYKSL